MENKGYQPRKVQTVTIDSYRGQAILHVPVGPEKYDFAFGIKKAEAIDELVRSGKWAKIMEDLRVMQAECDKVSARKNEVIQL